MSMAIFSPKLLAIAAHSHVGKTHLGFRPNYLPLRAIKKIHFRMVVGADIASGVSVTAPEETSLTFDERSLGSNGSPAAPVVESVAAEPVSGFQNSRRVGGTWDLKQFEKDGKIHWNSVIDAGLSLSLLHYYDVLLKINGSFNKGGI